MARGNRSERIFKDDYLKRLFLQTIVRAKSRYRFKVRNVCIMTTHFHMMITPEPGESLSRIMQWILSVYAIQYNKLFGFQGHVWYDRFKSVVIESLRQFVRTFNFIIRNPEDADLVSRGRDYLYGGIVLIRAGPPRLLDPPSLLMRLLFPEFSESQLPDFSSR
jgi:putative transposase